MGSTIQGSDMRYIEVTCCGDCPEFDVFSGCIKADKVWTKLKLERIKGDHRYIDDECPLPKAEDMVIRCSKCNRERPHYAKGLCKSCYGTVNAVRKECKECGRELRIYAGGKCRTCYRDQQRRKHRADHW